MFGRDVDCKPWAQGPLAQAERQKNIHFFDPRI